MVVIRSINRAYEDLMFDRRLDVLSLRYDIKVKGGQGSFLEAA